MFLSGKVTTCIVCNTFCRTFYGMRKTKGRTDQSVRANKLARRGVDAANPTTTVCSVT